MNDRDSLIDLLIHDLTGPLSIAATSINNLLSKEDRYGAITDKQRKTLNMILRNTTKAQTFLHEMIEVYRCEEGLFRREECSVPHILREALLEAVEMMDPDIVDELSPVEDCDTFFQLIRKYAVYVTISGAYASRPFFHDQKKIRQIIRNFITNALKYRRDRLDITVSGDEDLSIAFIDDGAGIPIDKQGYIFKRFFCSQDKTESSPKGLGFGLSCVKMLVESLGGDIKLASEEGKGSTFTVCIPPLKM